MEDVDERTVDAERPAPETRPEPRPEDGNASRRRSRLLVGLTAAALLVLTAVCVAVRVASPSDGTATHVSRPEPDGEDIDVIVGGSQLRDGDVVVAIEGRPLVRRIRVAAEEGDTLTYRVRRGDQLLDVRVPVRSYPLGAVVGKHWPSLLLVASMLLVGGYVFARRPDDHAARALLLTATLLALGSTYWILAPQALDLAGGPRWWSQLAGAVAYALFWPAMLHFALLFPEPGPLVRRHRKALALLYVIPAIPYVAHIATTLPGATTPLARVAPFVPRPTLAEYLFPVLVLAAFLFTYREATDHSTRIRLRWVAGSFAIGAIPYLLFWQLPALLLGRSWGHYPTHVLLFLAVPIALGVAILRVQLFDINVAVRRSLVYGCLMLFVGGIYILAVGVLGRAVQGGTDWVALAITVGVALLLSPLHRRTRRVVSRVLYGERDDPYTIVSRLGERLETTPVPMDVLPQLVTTVAEALRLPYAAIELFWADGVEEAARYGDPTGAQLVLPLTHQGELIGRLVVGERDHGEGFGSRDRRVLEGLARQVGLAVRAARLTIEMQRSRERLVAAREEERRRLRRDLHDGLGPTLAATALQLQTARRLVARDPDGAASMLGELSDQIQGTITDVRHIVDDLRPATLDQLGLAAALQEQAFRFAAMDATADSPGRQLAVTVEGDLGDLPAAVEVAVFRIGCEAMNNAVRHGQARTCEVHIRRRDDLELVVTDDGRGISESYRSGVGLESMRERAEELGGSLLLGTRPGGGTVVSVRLPLPS